nr:probable receptor-like protein kinase At5g47070 [Ipomoea batatas]
MWLKRVILIGLDEDGDLELHWDDEVDDVNVKNTDELVKWREIEISTSVGEDFSEAISDVLNQIDLEGEKDFVESEDELKSIGSSSDIEGENSLLVYREGDEKKHSFHYKVGMIFSSNSQFKWAVEVHEAVNNKSIKFTKNDKRRVQAKCRVLKRVFWAVCKATTQPEFKQHIEAMQVLNPKAAEWVEDDDLKLFRVHLTTCSCSCRRWDLTGIPCVHAISAIFENGQDPIEYTNWFYSVEAYLKSYEPAILPISSSDQWRKTGAPPPLPPKYKPQPGRPKKLRRKDPIEKEHVPTKLGRIGEKKKCGLCGQHEHNKRRCKASKETMKCFALFFNAQKKEEPNTVNSNSALSSLSGSSDPEGRPSSQDYNSRNASDASTESRGRTQFPNLSERPSNLRVFAFSELKTATKNFSHSTKIGEGGFGPVYKGTIKNSEDPTKRIDVAIKQLSRRGIQAS